MDTGRNGPTDSRNAGRHGADRVWFPTWTGRQVLSIIQENMTSPPADLCRSHLSSTCEESRIIYSQSEMTYTTSKVVSTMWPLMSWTWSHWSAALHCLWFMRAMSPTKHSLWVKLRLLIQLLQCYCCQVSKSVHPQAIWIFALYLSSPFPQLNLELLCLVMNGLSMTKHESQSHQQFTFWRYWQVVWGVGGFELALCGWSQNSCKTLGWVLQKSKGGQNNSLGCSKGWVGELEGVFSLWFAASSTFSINQNLCLVHCRRAPVLPRHCLILACIQRQKWQEVFISANP